LADANKEPRIALVIRFRAALAERDGLIQIALVLAAFGAYEGARLLMAPNWQEAFANAQRIVSFEHLVGIGWEQPLQRAFLAIPEAVEAMNVFYFVGHFGISAVFFVWLYHRSRRGFLSFRDAFLVSTALAVLIHWAFPTAPPRLAHVGIEDTLMVLSGIDIGSQTSSALSNPTAAVPSLHAAWAVGVGYGLLRYGRGRLLRVLGVVYPALVVLTIIVTGNHFVVDALAGAAVLGVGFGVAAWRRLTPRTTARGHPATAGDCGYNPGTSRGGAAR
jgi:hypothetical protein